MKKIFIGIATVIIILALVGIYKFSYLANQSGYGIDGNQMSLDNVPQSENCAADGKGCKQFNPNKKTEKKVVQNLKSVNPETFKALAETGEYTIIDLRTPEELLPKNGGKIFPEAINIDFYEPAFVQNLLKLDRDEKYLIYCRSGNRSGKTLDLMKKTGFKNVVELAGGKKAWDQVYGDIKKTPKQPESVVCTMDVKICPDGSAVGRSGPNCEFAACPSTENPEMKIENFDNNITEGNLGTISLEEVAQHNSKSDCWGVIGGKVYDVTAFFGKHPGGDANLYRICGIDATNAFRGKHGEDTKPNTKLQAFYIGDLQ